jgi:hypothetical protein
MDLICSVNCPGDLDCSYCKHATPHEKEAGCEMVCGDAEQGLQGSCVPADLRYYAQRARIRANEETR